MTDDDYKPADLTPLYDAIAVGIIQTDRYLGQTGKDHDVIFTIMTDGLENFSTNYALEDIFRMISEKEKNGWVFNYLGANQDAWQVARNIGIKSNHAADYDAYDPRKAFHTVADSTINAKFHMKRGMPLRRFFTKEDRRRLLKK